MEEQEFTFSKQYVEMFNKAKAIKNIDEMGRIFAELAAEVGLQDPQSDQAQRAWGKAAAEYLNNRGKGPECKKI